MCEIDYIIAMLKTIEAKVFPVDVSERRQLPAIFVLLDSFYTESRAAAK